jgi:hypothetical protein
VVSYGPLAGWFKVVDARSGKLLWKFKTASVLPGSAMPDIPMMVAETRDIAAFLYTRTWPTQ